MIYVLSSAELNVSTILLYTSVDNLCKCGTLCLYYCLKSRCDSLW